MPRLDRDFLGGIRGALAERGVEHRLAIELTGNAALPASVVEKAQRLLLEHGPAIVTGVIGTLMMPHLASLFDEARTALVISNIGADPLLDAGHRHPYVIHHSLELWRSTYALGRWAAEHVGKRACLAVGYHESGYSIVGAFWAGFSDGGGEILATEVTHRSSPDEDPSPAVARLVEHDPELVVALSSGPDGVSFVGAYRRLTASKPIPLIASALMLHPRWLAEMGDAALGIRTVFGWDAAADSPAAAAFDRARALGGSPDREVFALLGYECGLAIAAAAHSADALDAEPFLRALNGVSIDSPRGALRVDPAAGEIRGGQHHVFEVQRDAESGVRLVRIEALAVDPECESHYAELRRQEIRPGWINPYLVT